MVFLVWLVIAIVIIGAMALVLWDLYGLPLIGPRRALW